MESPIELKKFCYDGTKHNSYVLYKRELGCTRPSWDILVPPKDADHVSW